MLLVLQITLAASALFGTLLSTETHTFTPLHHTFAPFRPRT